MEEAKVLVVEDQPSVARQIARFLEAAGLQPICAYDGQSALDAFQATHPALIVLDWMLPDIDGIEVQRIIRQTSDIPIIMVTARNDVPEVVRGLEMGADDYLTKPFSGRELVARINRLLRPRGSQATLPASISA
jgi:two-component system response regulator VicR